MALRRRAHERFKRRLEIEFSARDQEYRALTRNCSLGGIFIKTNHAFVPGTIVDMRLHLPDGSISKLRGCVRNSMKTPVAPMKNGMGIELFAKDSHYINFINSFSSGSADAATDRETTPDTDQYTKTDEKPSASPPDFVVIQCPQCGVRNKINRAKGLTGHKCGKCRVQIEIQSSESYQYTETDEKPSASPPDFVIIQCLQCGVKNKIDKAKGLTGHKCGKCRAALPIT